jgi:DNA helicase-2/ATP-dependent DNA helicase PcrA
MRDLQGEYERLNPEQKEAVRSSSNTVVLAGPGSGKTETLVIKIAHLLSSGIRAPRGLACLTYNNDTVKEFRNRLAGFGIHPGRRVFLGTVHSFCLNCILRPFGSLVSERFSGGIRVAAEKQAGSLLEQAMDQVGLNETSSWVATRLTRLRRRIDCREDISGFAEADIQVLDRYRASLETNGLVDFEEMVSSALRFVREEDWIPPLLAARFPWLIIDEYQDLGGPLHSIVTTLLETTDIRVFAVGDPDQTIYDFTGASPEYLRVLSERDDFRSISLRFNYRSGKRLIAASQAALAPSEPRGYRPAPGRQDDGEVFFINANDALGNHASAITKQVWPEIRARGIPPEEVAILYRQKGTLLTLIQKSLVAEDIPFHAERDSRYPRSPIVQWLQDCAGISFAGTDFDDVSFEDVLRYFHGIAFAAGTTESEPDLSLRTRVHAAVFSEKSPEMPLGEWLGEIDSALSLTQMLSATPELSDDHDTLSALIADCAEGKSLATHSLQDFARDGRVKGRMVLTTLHSSKGRQFDAVILPGLVEGILPRRPWDRATRTNPDPPAPVLAEDRRLFYVGFTRARKLVFLIYGESFTNDYGYPVTLGVSRFVKEIHKRLHPSS